LNRFSPTFAKRAPRDFVIIPFRDAEIKRFPAPAPKFRQFRAKKPKRAAKVPLDGAFRRRLASKRKSVRRRKRLTLNV
jgi:hypothetical protein